MKISVSRSETFSYFRSFQLLSPVKTCQSWERQQRSKSDCHAVAVSSRNISLLINFISIFCRLLTTVYLFGLYSWNRNGKISIKIRTVLSLILSSSLIIITIFSIRIHETALEWRWQCWELLKPTNQTNSDTQKCSKTFYLF